MGSHKTIPKNSNKNYQQMSYQHKQSKQTQVGYYNKNRDAPRLRATIKIHKNPVHIRPALNWRKAPAYVLTV
jgi:hypothetical protein